MFIIGLQSHFIQAKEKIIIDADVGIDDTMAILYASASPVFELIGLTTTFGNASIENSTRNACYIIERLGLDIPVVQGASVPLIIAPEPPTDFVHGDNGLGNVIVPTVHKKPQSTLSAAQFIIEQSKLYPNELTLVPIGRLTNIALALRLDPTLASRIKRVVIMGGAFEVPGNVTPVAEANIIGDPHAADIVFQADWDVVTIPLDVTTKIMVVEKDLAQVAISNPLAGGFIKEFTQFYLDFHYEQGLNGFYIHDPSPFIYLEQPELFSTKNAAIRVVTQGMAIGQTIAAFSPQRERLPQWQHVKVNTYANQVDSDKAKKLLLTRFSEVNFIK
ncbi:nucleoside hydrolase [Colwellia echini]|nr:nucleoside hydrolase [Colwellia echini]